MSSLHLQISEDLSRVPSFPEHRIKHIRIARVVVEAFRLGLPDVRWFLMGDDDTIFSPDNVVDLLSRWVHGRLLPSAHTMETF